MQGQVLVVLLVVTNQFNVSEKKGAVAVSHSTGGEYGSGLGNLIGERSFGEEAFRDDASGAGFGQVVL